MVKGFKIKSSEKDGSVLEKDFEKVALRIVTRLSVKVSFNPASMVQVVGVLSTGIAIVKLTSEPFFVISPLIKFVPSLVAVA